MSKNRLTTPLTALFFSLGCLDAAVFQTYSQSANSVGYAHADMAALADDASTAWYNPAGMVKLCSPEMAIGISVIPIHLEFNGTVGYTSINDIFLYEEGIVTAVATESLSTPFQAPRAVSDTSPVIPAFNAVWPYHCYDFHFALGLAIDAPWGLETDWRYSHLRTYAEQTSIYSIQINPSVAFGYQGLSFAVGYGRELIQNQITASFINVGAFVRTRGWSNTYNLALMYDVEPNFTVGATYRPGQTHHLKGNSYLDLDTGTATCDFKTPAFLTTGFKYDVNRCWTLLGTFGCTFWSQVKDINIYTGVPSVYPDLIFLDLIEDFIPELIGLPPGFTVQINDLLNLQTGLASVRLNGKDTVLISLGSKYKANDIWTVKCGLAYDQSPVRTKTRELRIPDNDHYILSVGTRCDFNEFVRADLGFEYIYIPKSGIRNNPIVAVPSAVPSLDILDGGVVVDVIPLNNITQVPPSKQGFNGSINNSAMVLSLQLSVIFP